MKFSDCRYDATGAIVCTFRGLPFQVSEADTPDEWTEIHDLIAAGEVSVDAYVAPPKPSDEELKVLAEADGRGRREEELDATDFVINRHRDQKDMGIDTTLTGDEYSQWLKYRQDLRNITSQAGWPLSVNWPEAPLLVP